jgi:hypothetical protein
VEVTSLKDGGRSWGGAGQMAKELCTWWCWRMTCQWLVPLITHYAVSNVDVEKMARGMAFNFVDDFFMLSVKFI